MYTFIFFKDWINYSNDWPNRTPSLSSPTRTRFFSGNTHTIHRIIPCRVYAIEGLFLSRLCCCDLKVWRPRLLSLTCSMQLFYAMQSKHMHHPLQSEANLKRRDRAIFVVHVLRMNRETGFIVQPSDCPHPATYRPSTSSNLLHPED